ncbi:MFS transporter [Pelagibius litoralis]|uniref:MFS transporter n=1 Tax=Pelagibius litoralis TaxID=374515 RepID=A0A967KBL4_9PROT|nr:MFS transporter [Pelagibius litoralis]NIA69195.1 MFS transporter [Pelagibius litoralis]
MKIAPCDNAVILTGPRPEPCRREARPIVLMVTILGSSLAFVDGTVVTVALPVIGSHFGGSLSLMQWVVNAYALLLAALLLIGGAAGDLYGRRRIFNAGVAIFALASLWCGLAESAEQLIAARALQGFGAAFLVPNSLAIISAAFPESERGRAIGTWAGFSAIAAALGPVLGGWLVDLGSWRLVFLINLPIAALTLALSLWRVPESRDASGGRRMDWPGAVLAVLALAALTYSLTSLGEDRILSQPLLLTALGGLIGLFVFLWVEARSTSPMLPLDLFRSAAFSGANLLTLFLYFALSGVLFFLPITMIEVHGHSATLAGAAFLPFTLVMAFLSRWAGGLLDRFGARLPLTLGPLIAAAGFLLFIPVEPGASFWQAVVPAMLVLGLGMAVTVAPLSTVVMNALSEGQSGLASGVNNAVSRLSGLLAVAGLGALAALVFERSLAELLTGPEAAALSGLRYGGDIAAVTLPELAAADLEAAFRNAMLQAFHAIALIGAALAVLSALCGFFLMPRRVVQRGKA